MNNGDSWVKPTDLNAKKNPENVRLFYHHAKVLKIIYFEEYWIHIKNLNIDAIVPDKLFNFCANTRNVMREGYWDAESNKNVGFYKQWKLLLDRIDFKMNNSSE